MTGMLALTSNFPDDDLLWSKHVAAIKYIYIYTYTLLIYIIVNYALFQGQHLLNEKFWLSLQANHRVNVLF